MKTYTLTETELTATIAKAIAQALGQAQPQTKTTSVPKPAAKIAPAKAKPTAKVAPKQTEVVDNNIVELHVGTAKDKRVKLPARMFDKNNTARINGTVYHGSPSDGGRCKVQAAVFGASEGQTIRITRTAGSNWTSEVVGAKAKSATAKVQPKAQASVPAQTAKPQAKVQPKIKTAVPAAAKPAAKVKAKNVDAMKKLVAQTAAKAIAGAHKGNINENFPETDARRFLGTRDKKFFNQNAAAFGYKLDEAVQMLAGEVFE